MCAGPRWTGWSYWRWHFFLASRPNFQVCEPRSGKWTMYRSVHCSRTMYRFRKIMIWANVCVLHVSVNLVTKNYDPAMLLGWDIDSGERLSETMIFGGTRLARIELAAVSVVKLTLFCRRTVEALSVVRWRRATARWKATGIYFSTRRRSSPTDKYTMSSATKRSSSTSAQLRIGVTRNWKENLNDVSFPIELYGKPMKYWPK